MAGGGEHGGTARVQLVQNCLQHSQHLKKKSYSRGLVFKITQCMMRGGGGGRMGEREAREQRSEEEEVMKEGNRPSLGATA